MPIFIISAFFMVLGTIGALCEWERWQIVYWAWALFFALLGIGGQVYAGAGS